MTTLVLLDQYLVGDVDDVLQKNGRSLPGVIGADVLGQLPDLLLGRTAEQHLDTRTLSLNA